MTQSEIECFLAICRYKTITLASENLYITQPSLSARLKNLEKELGGALFHRKKGCREMTLTPAGKAFYRLAVQYESLMKQMQSVCKKNENTVRVSAINSVGTYFLPTVYHCFMQEHPNCSLEIQDMELDSVSQSILNGNTDLAFTSGKTSEEGLLQTPIFLERMVLIAGKSLKFRSPVSLKDLKKKMEIYVEWSRPYASWHKQNLKKDSPLITLSIMSQLKQFMEEGDCWAIVPITVGKKLSEEGLVEVLEPAFDVPLREISVLTAVDHNKEIVHQFFRCIKKITKESEELHALI